MIASDLIVDKNRTPLNIGRAINLAGFKFDEAKPALIPGLIGKVDHPEAVLQQILDWTAGQPFITQKLCKLVYDYGESSTPNIDQLVQKYVIDNWESQDNPQHLKTIRDRILNNQKSTRRLLGIYQQILQSEEIPADDSLEQIELQLSGLVFKHQNKLRVYNPIYQSVFDLNWVRTELNNLRPVFYREALNAWLGSNCQEESWLLRGKVLEEAKNWADGKSLKDEDYQFLSASQQFDRQQVQIVLATKEEEVRILAEANEALVKANQTLISAQGKAKRMIHIGFLTMSFSIFIGVTFIFALPWFAVLLNNLGYDKYKKGMVEDAVRDYEMALMLKPNYVTTLYNMGMADEKLKDYKKAETYYNLAISVNRNYAPAYSNLARLYIIAEKEYTGAVKLLDKSLKISAYEKLDQDDLNAYNYSRYSIYKNLGWAKFQMKRYPEALENLSQAIKINPRAASAYCLLAQVKEASGNKDNLSTDWSNCLLHADQAHPDEIEWSRLAKRRLGI